MFNLMESLTCILLMLNLILGYYIIDNEYSVLKWIAYGVLGVCNGAMVGFLAWKMFTLKVMKYVMKIVNAFKKCFGKKESKEAKEEELNKKLLNEEESFAQTEPEEKKENDAEKRSSEEKDYNIL